MQIYEGVTTISEPGFSGNLIKKGPLFHKCQPSLSYTFWRYSRVFRELPVVFLFLVSILLCSPSHKHLRYTNKRRLMSVPLVWRRVTEVRLPGPDGSQTPGLSCTSLRLIPCQREVTAQTRRPPSSPSSVLLLLHPLRQPAGPAGLGSRGPAGVKGRCRTPRHLLDFLSCLRHFRSDNLDFECQC